MVQCKSMNWMDVMEHNPLVKYQIQWKCPREHCFFFIKLRTDATFRALTQQRRSLEVQINANAIFIFWSHWQDGHSLRAKYLMAAFYMMLLMMVQWGHLNRGIFFSWGYAPLREKKPVKFERKRWMMRNFEKSLVKAMLLSVSALEISGFVNLPESAFEANAFMPR